MLDELIEKHFAKLEEVKKLEEFIKETKEVIKSTKKIVSDADASLARLMRESKHESFLFQKDGKNFIVYSNGDECVFFEEIPTIQDMKKELAVGRMLQGVHPIAEQESAIPGYNVNGTPLIMQKKTTRPKTSKLNSWTATQRRAVQKSLC
jgi:deoxyxylulose-5-phosphate synthase